MPTPPPKPPSATPSRATAAPGHQPLPPEVRAALEDLLQQWPLARSRPAQEGAPAGVRAPPLAGRVLSLPAPAPVSEQELVERMGLVMDPFFKERERAEGEPVAEGDAVLVDWEARVSGSPAPFVQEDLAEGRVAPSPELPGFFESLVGQKVGSQARFSLVMPEDFTELSARGQKVDFEVWIRRAVERKAPEPRSAEFLQALGRGSTLEEVLESLHRELETERDEELEDEARRQLLDVLADEVEAVIPAEWVELEVREQWTAHKVLASAAGEAVEPLASWQASPRLRTEAELKLRLDLALQALCAQGQVRPLPEDEIALLTALAESTGLEVEELGKAIARDAGAARLVKKAAWFLRATEHALSQVIVELQEAGAEP